MIRSQSCKDLGMNIAVIRKSKDKGMRQDCVWHVQVPGRMTTMGRVVSVVGNKVKEVSRA